MTTHDHLQDDATAEKNSVNVLHDKIVADRREPRDGYEPLPVWLVSMFAILVFWGGWYLASYNGGFRADILEENPEARYASFGGAPKTLDPIALGQKLFLGNCVSCHQTTGLGVAGQYPPLDGSEYVTGEPTILKRILLCGLEGPIEVNGKTFNGAMPVFGQKLSDEQIAAVLTFIRQAWSNRAGAITADAVKVARESVKDRKKPWSIGELKALPLDK